MLSIIMPVKNTALYLKECIDSILGQTFTDWELIAVDDSSNDESLQILNAYANQDKKIKVFSNSGSGIIDALQTGYKHSLGNFVTRMDSDDVNEPQKYERMISQLKNHGSGYIALGQLKYFAAEGVQEGFKKYEAWLNNLIKKGNCFDEIYKECVIPSPCWMLHRSDFESIGGFDAVIYPEDYDLCFRMYKQGLKPIPTDEILFNWRDYSTRTSRTDEKYKKDELLKIKCYYFLEIDFDETKNLIVWGAGKRGKFIAKYFIEKNVPFVWVCNNKNKIGKEIYGLLLQCDSILNEIEEKQIIVSVAKREEREDIKTTCTQKRWESYFFC